MNSRLSLSRRFFYCALSACLVWFCFPNFIEKTLTPPTAFFAWFALVPFFLALRGAGPKLAAILGFTFGFLQFGGILYWIAILQAAQYLSGLGWAVLVFYLSLYFLVFGWLYAIFTNRLKISEPWMVPFLWLGLEYIRGTRPWGGFNWGEIGYSQAPYPVLLALTTFTGVYGLTFLIVGVNVMLAKGLEPQTRSEDSHAVKSKGWPRWAYFLLPLVLGILLISWGKYEIQAVSLKKVGTVALLQPSIDQNRKWSRDNQMATYARLGDLVAEASTSHPDLIVWPETAVPDYLLLVPSVLQKIRHLVIESKTYNLIGCLDATRVNISDVDYFNAAVQFNPRGYPEGVYHKRHLVPFGEFVPFQKYLTFLGPVVGDLGDFNSGTSYQKFETSKFSYSPMICYEVIFPDDVRQAMMSKADVLVNISNDAWFGLTASPYQHAMMAVMRSAEERKALLRSANTGISLVTDPFGHLLDSTNLYETRVLTGDVWVASGGRTFYARFGNWLPRLSWIVILVLMILAMFKNKKNTNPISDGPEACLCVAQEDKNAKT